ncbi:MAG: hypothetical protein IID41_12525 [Planctomycetes bacterium]|nr:hypothetical protein [Planctomycetota bacterium]
MMSETPNIEEEIAKLSTLISEARELITTDHVIDLGNFSTMVEEFCKLVAANPPEDTERVNALIEAMIGDLNTAGSMRKFINGFN